MEKILILAILFFSGCGIPPEPKIIYIKQKVPKQNTLELVREFKITDIYTVDERYYGVNKSQLERASDTSVLLRKQNYFYRKQAQDFNKLFNKAPETSEVKKKRDSNASI